MTLTIVRDAIAGLIRTAWLANATTAPVVLVWDDVEGDKPGHDNNGDPIEWARVTIRHDPVSRTETVTSEMQGKIQHSGIVTVQVFVPKGYGLGRCDELGQLAKGFLQKKRIPGVDGWFLPVAASEAPAGGPWAQINVLAPFVYSEST